MSGESGGSIYIPVNAATLPVVGVVLASRALVAGLASAADAAFVCEKRRKARRDAQRLLRSGLKESVGEFSVEIKQTLQVWEEENRMAGEQMLRELEQSRRRTLKEMEKLDPEGYRESMERLKTAGEELSEQFQKIQDTHAGKYQNAICESIERIRRKVDQAYLENLEELKNRREEQQDLQERASVLAGDYLNEAEELLRALSEEFEGERFGAGAFSLLQEQLRDARAQYEAGNYQTALAVAKDISLSTIETIYKADAKRQEWENYQQCALTAVCELYTCLKEQAVITQETKEQAQRQLGKELPDEIVGIAVSEYTERMPNGKTQYEILEESLQEWKGLLESERVKELDTRRLKEYVTHLHTEVYPAVSRTVFQGILTMSNAFARQDISEEIIDFFEEHNFSFTGYSYDGNEHKGALHIGLENEINGEEIVVTLAPQMLGGEVRTQVEIDQFAGEKTNEERRRFYRTGVEEVVKRKTPGAQIRLECNEASRNRFSTKENLREKIKS